MLSTRRRLGRLVTTLAIAAAPLVAVAAAPSAAHADTDDCGVTGNIVVDCGFEGLGYNDQAPAPGWTLTPSPTDSELWTWYYQPRSGGFSAWFGSSMDDTISQTLSGTVPGARYEASLWVANYQYSGEPDHIRASVTGTADGTATIVDQTNVGLTSWTQFTASFTAGSTAPTIEIAASDTNWIEVDDVSVVQTGPALPSSVPGGTYDAAYSTSLAAAGGTAPYTYAVSDGSLPAGLTLDSDTGLLHATPTAAGDSSFSVTATDSADPAQTAMQAYTLTVAKADPIVALSSPTTGGVVGESAPIDASSTSTEGALAYSSGSTGTCAVSGPTVTYLHPGTCVIDVDQASSANYNAASGTTSVPVSQAATTTTVAVHPGSIVADVAPVAPGDGSPTGSVDFSVDGTVVGTAPVTGNEATLAYAVPAGATRQVAAVYSGDTDFTGSSDSTSRNDPSITATVTSYRPVSGFGWYRTPIHVSFTCTLDGAPLTAACPAPVTIDHDVAGRSVTRTILATDGGADTVTVSGLNLDQHAPAVRVTGVRDGAVYNGRAPAAHCLATDALSGVASCRIARDTDGSVTSYVATAKDRAGNTSRTHGSYRVLSTYLVGAPFRNGAFQVRRQSYSLVTTAATRPHYVYAAPAPARPHGGNVPFTRTGPHTWAITVSLGGLPRGSTWDLGIRVGTTLRVVKVHVR